MSVACVNPTDVVRTRVYNAPADRPYASGVDAALQLVRTEGPLAFYKGSVTHFLRLGPRMVLVFGILEQFKGYAGGEACARVVCVSAVCRAPRVSWNFEGADTAGPL